jgi:hypothetical protein
MTTVHNTQDCSMVLRRTLSGRMAARSAQDVKQAGQQDVNTMTQEVTSAMTYAGRRTIVR